jgi:hypothetical protein
MIDGMGHSAGLITSSCPLWYTNGDQLTEEEVPQIKRKWVGGGGVGKLRANSQMLSYYET